MSKLLDYAKNSGFFNSVDYHFAKMIGDNEPKLALLALLISHAYGLKHTMVPYSYLYHANDWITAIDQPKSIECAQTLKELAGIHSDKDWHSLFTQLKKTQNSPISITDNGIYLTKNLNFEQSIVQFLQTHQTYNVAQNHGLSPATIELLHQLFPKEGELNKQKLAAVNALLSPVSIISGGPGTGKTTTVIKILLLLLSEHPNLHISLTAPTGKAAARLTESIEKQKNSLTQSHPALAYLLDKIPNQSTTLHRLLSLNPRNVEPKYHSYHPLPTDLIIVDEASMIDLYIFDRLIKALPQHVRVIILGDKDQLASVEAGAIMGEICQEIGYDAARLELLASILDESLTTEFKPQNVPLNNVTLLTKSHRFSADSGIGQLAKIVNAQNYSAFAKTIAKFPAELSFINSREDHWQQCIKESLTDYIALCAVEKSPIALFKALNTVRILCATNVSEFGTHAINEFISLELFQQNNNHQLYHGQAIMILQNDYVNNVFNGDVGIIIEDNDRISAYFENENGELRSIPVQLLPHYETSFAMTIHKSQGSEFDQVVVVLPDFSSQILTKELLYTGITRAKKRLTLIGSPYHIKHTIENKTERFSGIGKQLSAGISQRKPPKKQKEQPQEKAVQFSFDY